MRCFRLGGSGALLSLGLLMMAGNAGCARPARSVRSETTATVQTSAPEIPVVTERHSVYTEHVERDEPRGVLSTVVHFVGEVLSLPFRLVGGLIRAIF